MKIGTHATYANTARGEDDLRLGEHLAGLITAMREEATNAPAGV
jgi:hypothetical protein